MLDIESPSFRTWVSRVFSQLFDSPELRVPSTRMEKYRNKMTYNLPLPQALSILAEDRINHVCREVDEWVKLHDQEKPLFREVMVKSTRDGCLLVRVTVQDSIYAEEVWGPAFVAHLRHLFPTIQCFCYNVAHSRARPTKDAPLRMLYGDGHLVEHTLTGLSYQIGPDTFSEINHEVESLQSEKTVEWIKSFEGTRAILLVSGRDVSSFGLNFGTIRGSDGQMIFSEVVAVQHCPLVHKDATANFGRHSDKLKSTVLHRSKPEMVAGVAKALEAALKRQNHPPVVVVTTGGRKGLNPGYLAFLKENPTVSCIVYNSCSTKSLERDMEAFLGGAVGFSLDGFASYDFFPGTGYTASLTRLVRRPKTLVLPVGPAGTGKSTLAKTLTSETAPDTVLWWQRDAVFSSLREQGIGMNKAKQMVHENLLSFLRASECNCSVRIVDSTNGSPDARSLYVHESMPDLVILVELRPRGCEEDIIEFLLEKTRDRLGNSSTHPSFPDSVDEQRMKHSNILKGIHYSSDGENASSVEKTSRLVRLSCDPSDEAMLSSLPFEVFVEFASSRALSRFLTRKKN